MYDTSLCHIFEEIHQSHPARAVVIKSYVEFDVKNYANQQMEKVCNDA